MRHARARVGKSHLEETCFRWSKNG
jgi:hypothetical protein